MMCETEYDTTTTEISFSDFMLYAYFFFVPCSTDSRSGCRLIPVLRCGRKSTSGTSSHKRVKIGNFLFSNHSHSRALHAITPVASKTVFFHSPRSLRSHFFSSIHPSVAQVFLYLVRPCVIP